MLVCGEILCGMFSCSCSCPFVCCCVVCIVSEDDRVGSAIIVLDDLIRVDHDENEHDQTFQAQLWHDLDHNLNQVGLERCHAQV